MMGWPGIALLLIILTPLALLLLWIGLELFFEIKVSVNGGSEDRFIGWMADYIHSNMPITRDEAAHQARSAYLDYVTESKIMFGDEDYDWSKLGAEILALEVVLMGEDD